MDARGWSGCSLTLLIVNFAMLLCAKAKRSRPQLPVILATGYADVDVSKDQGYAVLRKPFQIGDLARTVKAALTRSHV